jgi:hypothetical protein
MTLFKQLFDFLALCVIEKSSRDSETQLLIERRLFGLKINPELTFQKKSGTCGSLTNTKARQLHIHKMMDYAGDKLRWV